METWYDYEENCDIPEIHLTNTSPIETALHNDLLLEILLQLNNPRALPKLRYLNKRFKSLADDDRSIITIFTVLSVFSMETSFATKWFQF